MLSNFQLTLFKQLCAFNGFTNLINSSYTKWTPLEFKFALASRSTQNKSSWTSISPLALKRVFAHLVHSTYIFLISYELLHLNTFISSPFALKYTFRPSIHSSYILLNTNKSSWTQMCPCTSIHSKHMSLTLMNIVAFIYVFAYSIY